MERREGGLEEKRETKKSGGKVRVPKDDLNLKLETEWQLTAQHRS